MQVMLDDEQWTVHDGTTLMEILAQVSDKAHAKCRVVTALQVGDRKLTDRDLTHALLAQSGTQCAHVQATSESMDQVIKGADDTMDRYAGLLKSDGTALVNALRCGHSPGGAFDAWFGRLADYLECLEIKLSQSESNPSGQSLAPWVARLVDARVAGDVVGLADLLEYEVLGRLRG